LHALQVDEYEKLGSYAMIGLPEGEYKTRYGTFCIVNLEQAMLRLLAFSLCYHMPDF
jgi:hypothetical protein